MTRALFCNRCQYPPSSFAASERGTFGNSCPCGGSFILSSRAPVATFENCVSIDSVEAAMIVEGPLHAASTGLVVLGGHTGVELKDAASIDLHGSYFNPDASEEEKSKYRKEHGSSGRDNGRNNSPGYRPHEGSE
jgi:hypothetical protein